MRRINIIGSESHSIFSSRIGSGSGEFQSPIPPPPGLHIVIIEDVSLDYDANTSKGIGNSICVRHVFTSEAAYIIPAL